MLMQNPGEIPCKLSSIGRLTSYFFSNSYCLHQARTTGNSEKPRTSINSKVSYCAALELVSVNFPRCPLIDLNIGLLEQTLIRGE